MATPYHHAISSAKKHGGNWEDYIAIHQWFDETKAWVGDIRHRVFRHHSEGIFECEVKFGITVPVTMTNGMIKNVPVRVIGEQHVTEDCGFIPCAKQYFDNFKPTPWMNRVGKRLDKIEEETTL